MPRDPLAGEAHGRAVLTDHEVDLLLELRADGLSLSRIAETFEISKSQAGRICRGLAWTHLVDPPDPAPRRLCPDPLPAVPARDPDHDTGQRALALMAYMLSVHSDV